jgi:hypothetical protein
MATANNIGERGEAIFIVLITDFCGRDRPYFRPHFLGEKFATLDYLVELVDPTAGAPFFFVQVKTTGKGYKTVKGQHCLKVSVSRRDVGRMVAYPAPTYVVGIDEENVRDYIASANEPTGKGMSALPTKFPLDCCNLPRLWQEVQSYWACRDMILKASIFHIG